MVSPDYSARGRVRDLSGGVSRIGQKEAQAGSVKAAFAWAWNERNRLPADVAGCFDEVVNLLDVCGLGDEQLAHGEREFRGQGIFVGALGSVFAFFSGGQE